MTALAAPVEPYKSAHETWKPPPAEEAIVVATGAPRERKCRHASCWLLRQ